MTLGALLARSPHLLLDFDGPMCAVFSAISSAEATRTLADSLRRLGVDVPEKITATADPFALLYYVAARAPEHSAAAEDALTDLEVAAVRTAPPSPHLRSMLDALARSGHTVTVVSNNSQAAVESFLAARRLTSRIDGCTARTDPDPGLLKPSPHLPRCAMTTLGASPTLCVLLGDSITDVQAAHRAGAASIALANKPTKRAPLLEARPDALISSLSEVADALQQ